MKNFPEREVKKFSPSFKPDPKKISPSKPKYNLRAETAKKKPKSAIGVLIGILDALFSVFIRSSAANKHGYAKCVTCPKWLPWRQMDCGHCYSRKSFAIRWEEINCGPQCKECNQMNGGEHEKFKAYINEKYGTATTGMLYALTQMPFKLDRNLLNEKINHYKRLMTKK